MTKIQLAELTDALTAALEVEKLTVDAWCERCDTINRVLDELGACISIEWRETSVAISYYSANISHTIEINDDAFRVVKNMRELAELLVAANDKARALEAKLPRIA